LPALTDLTGSAKTTNVELRRNPESSTRVKKRNDLMLIQVDLSKKTFVVVQEKTSHCSKFGTHKGPLHFLEIEEAVYLAELGAAAVLIDPKSNEFLSLNQVFALLPLFNLTFYQFCAYRSMARANYRVRRASEENKHLYNYEVYLHSINDVPFNEESRDNFLQFHLFIGRPNQPASDDLREFAKKSSVPVFIASGQSSCVRFSEILSPINSDLSIAEIPSVLNSSP